MSPARPATGLPAEVTVAINGLANTAFVAALCGVPPVAAINDVPPALPTCTGRMPGK